MARPIHRAGLTGEYLINAAVDIHHDDVSSGPLHHRRISGRSVNAGTAVLITLDHDTATVIALTTGEILSTHHIDPDHTYWRNQQQCPGRWPRLDVNDDPTHL